jgi:phospholipid/cholesterol/gamma-HCH transport system substrate-binding protein
MENKSHALTAGAFVLVVAALLIAMAAWLTRDHTEQRVFEISSKESVTGLQPQAGVRYKGVAVGRVTGIELDKSVRGNVLVRIAVNDSVPVTSSTFATLGFQGVTGLAFIALDDSGESAVALQTSPEVAGRIPMRQGLMSRLSDQGGKLLGQLEKASGQMNQLLDTDNQKNLMAAVTNLGQAAASITQLTNRANAMLSGTGPEGSLNLPRVAEQASTTLKSIAQTSEQLKISADTVRQSAGEFRQMSVRMNEPGGTLDRIARSTDALVNTSQTINTNVAPRLNRSAEDASRAARQVGRLVEGLNDNPQMLLTGKGAAAPGPGEAGFVAPTNP